MASDRESSGVPLVSPIQDLVQSCALGQSIHDGLRWRVQVCTHRKRIRLLWSFCGRAGLALNLVVSTCSKQPLVLLRRMRLVSIPFINPKLAWSAIHLSRLSSPRLHHSQLARLHDVGLVHPTIRELVPVLLLLVLLHQ